VLELLLSSSDARSASVGERVAEVLDAHRRLEIELDERTDHGRRTGATLKETD
jgi:hypothetical protein